jgi:hypothetical protein
MERNQMEDIGIDGAEVLIWIIRRFLRGAIDWIDLA